MIMKESPPVLEREEEERLVWLAYRYRKLKEDPRAEALLRGERPKDREERLLLDGLLQGKEAREKLVLHNLRLVFRFAIRYEGLGRAAGLTQEDLVHHGVEGLLEAVDTFNPTLGYRFSTWAYHKVRWAVQRPIRVRKGEVSLEEPVEGTEEITLGDTLASRLPSPEEVAEGRALETWFKEEFPRVALLTQEGLSLEEVAWLVGEDPKEMRRRLEAAFRAQGAFR